MEKVTDRPRSPLWNKALERYRVELGEEEADEYRMILEDGTLEELINQIKTLEQPNAREKAIINRLDPVLKTVSDFSAIVALCLGTDARLTALVWGSIRLILRLASSTSDALRDIVDVLEELSLTLPRFQHYERTLPINDDFGNALVEAYVEVICFYARTIHFYRSNPNDILRSKAWIEFRGDLGRTIQRIKSLSLSVEREAEIARMKLDRSGYAEVLDLMKKLKEKKLTDLYKPCYHVPHSVNPRFWGRQDALAAVKQALDPSEGSSQQRSFALWGMGGVGKTQIALRYALDSRRHFETILWISAENAIQNLNSFRDIARHIGLLQTDEEMKDAMSAMTKVKDWLNIWHQPWLLIFDNADDPELLKHAWPYGTQGSILITSRNPKVAIHPAGGRFHVQPFNDSESSSALLQLTDVDPCSQNNQEIAKRISHVLGGLPLALNQIGGFISLHQIPLRDFLPLYERNASKIDARKAGITDYEHSLGTVWDMSLKRLSGPSRSLQELLAFFDPGGVNEIVLRQGSQNLTDISSDLDFLADELDLLDAGEVLLEAALISKTKDKARLSAHRLIQTAVMRRLSAEDRTKYLDAVIQILCWGFPDTWSQDVGHQHQSWETCEMCLAHVEHLVKQKNKFQIRPSDVEAFAQLLLRCCWYLYERECYGTARNLIKEALDNFQDTSSLAFASAVELRGLVDMDTNFQTKALESFTIVLDIRSKLLARDHGLVSASLTTLGIVHTELGNLDKAYTYHQEAMDIRLKTGSDRIGNSYSNMASLLLRMGNADEAEEMLKRCPSLKDFTDETFLKTGNPRFSGDMVLLARIRERQGRLEEALRLATKALGFRRTLLGNRLKTCDSLYQVADLLHKREKLASATDLLNECVAISESLPEGEGQLARAMYKLSILHAEQGEAQVSEDLKDKARELRSKIVGSEASKDDESEDTYNTLNLWMLW